jgi:histidinol-phosphate aminotransferase
MNSEQIKTLFRAEVLALSAYKVTDARGFIKLDAMENPFSWPEDIKQQWLKSLTDCALNRYPDPEARQLCLTLRQNNGIADEHGLILGNGSDEIIQMLLMALPTGAGVLAPDPSFVMYKQVSLSLGLDYIGVPLNSETFDLELEAMLHAIAVHQPALVFLAYPNNPTGNLFKKEAVIEIIKACKGLVILDEAYAPFANASFMGELGHFDNLLVMRTLSKLGLAGLRLGYLAGHPSIIQELNKIRLPYNINILTQATAEFALQHNDLFNTQTAILCSERSRVFSALEAMNRFCVYPSAANFILFRTLPEQATPLFEHIKEQGVLIKNMSHQGGLMKDCLRVTIGKPNENDAFLKALSA